MLSGSKIAVAIGGGPVPRQPGAGARPLGNHLVQPIQPTRPELRRPGQSPGPLAGAGRSMGSTQRRQSSASLPSGRPEHGERELADRLRPPGLERQSHAAACAAQSADRFCRIRGWTAARCHRQETVRGANFLADVLCTRTGG